MQPRAPYAGVRVESVPTIRPQNAYVDAARKPAISGPAPKQAVVCADLEEHEHQNSNTFVGDLRYDGDNGIEQVERCQMKFRNR
jgi:hypothetical protein